MVALLQERLPERITLLLRNFGQVADKLSYNAYLVGGQVRDVFLKRDNLDVDIVIEGDGIHFAQEFAAHYGTRVRSHRKFGTAVLIFPDGFKADVATARMEYYEAPGAPPVVETSSLKLDLYRRDFTINTLAVQLNSKHYGSLVDYFGAQRDIKDKVLRVLHNLSFVEDPTRVFRAVRFEKRFGFKIGKLSLALIKNAAKINYFKDVTGRRLFLELKLILMEQDPIGAIERLDELNLLQFISPEIQLTDNVTALLHEIREVVAWYKLLYLEEPLEAWKVYWHGLTSPLSEGALKMLVEGLGMVDRDSRKMVFQRMHEREVLDALYKFRGKNYQLYTLLEPYDTETLLYFMAKANNEKMKRFISNYFTKLKGTRTHLTGKDLVRMGFKPGPIFKKIFDRLLEARLNNLLRTKEDEIRFVMEKYPEARAPEAPSAHVR
jgi:tRNA nucleotidyltransferase (CCA-adding enzyme)